MGSNDFDDVSVINGICIKCCACVKKCPAQAKYFDDPTFLRHKEELEVAYSARSEPELFI
jgi:ferredoxin